MGSQSEQEDTEDELKGCSKPLYQINEDYSER